MTAERLRELVKRQTGVTITKKFSIISPSDVERLGKLFRKVKEFIPESAYPTLITNLLIDLENIHCCCVSSRPGSPCYIGKLAGVEPIETPAVEILESFTHVGETPNEATNQFDIYGGYY